MFPYLCSAFDILDQDGAELVQQLHAGFIYQGPMLIKEIAEQLD
jgi:dihydroorotate dehydrogenase